MSQAHWNRIARNWHLVGAPLRPGGADIELFRAAVERHAAELGRTLNALILGVTPELATLAWPAGTTLHALDGSAAMIESLWRGERGRALQGSWTAAPFASGGMDAIVCDGGFGVLSFPETQRALLAEVGRMLRPGGVFVLRLFVPGCRSESLEAIAADLHGGRIGSLDVLKFRLWGALQESTATGVCPRDVVARIEEISGGLDVLASRYGFSADHVATLEYHRHSTARYCLSGVEDLAGLLGDLPGMRVAEVGYPDHPYGKRCPVVVIGKDE